LQRRASRQHTAHLIARLKAPEDTNQVIKEGMIIAGKRVWARKMKREPKRCLKCQKLSAGHFAVGCDSPEVCGTCGQEHRTAVCKEVDYAKYKCANCRASGHASWDHSCPKFEEACRRLEARDLENTYRYFPGSKPWTWEQERSGEPIWHNNGDGATAAQGTRQTYACEGAEIEPGEWDTGLFEKTAQATGRQELQQQEAAPSGQTRREGANPPVGSQDEGWTRVPRRLSRQSRLDEFSHVLLEGESQDRSNPTRS